MSFIDYVDMSDGEDKKINNAVTCTSSTTCPHANECIFAAEKNGIEQDLKGTVWCAHFTTRYNKIVDMRAEELAQFLDALFEGRFHNTDSAGAPWDTWVEENFCKNCKHVIVKNDAKEDVELRFCEAVGENLLNRPQCPFSGYERNTYSIMKWLEEIKPIEEIEQEFSI